MIHKAEREGPPGAETNCARRRPGDLAQETLHQQQPGPSQARASPCPTRQTECGWHGRAARPLRRPSPWAEGWAATRPVRCAGCPGDGGRPGAARWWSADSPPLMRGRAPVRLATTCVVAWGLATAPHRLGAEARPFPTWLGERAAAQPPLPEAASNLRPAPRPAGAPSRSRNAARLPAVQLPPERPGLRRAAAAAVPDGAVEPERVGAPARVRQGRADHGDPLPGGQRGQPGGRAPGPRHLPVAMMERLPRERYLLVYYFVKGKERRGRSVVQPYQRQKRRPGVVTAPRAAAGAARRASGTSGSAGTWPCSPGSP